MYYRQLTMNYRKEHSSSLLTSPYNPTTHYLLSLRHTDYEEN